ncbi:hypothetical protein CIPAW_01G005800 [Carya illinoinensis]|uniref:glucan endo-1,3-beta-D-glucosidase n=1 Tax=Carya illinoinensis TaxID=32201 RepID=A0A8T1RHG5_CARIL|nr:hypothetical protein CIPAW_01G005800 [Carya illinoinensis]
MVFAEQMLKMVLLFQLFFICALSRTGAGQESVVYLNLYNTSPEFFQASSHSALPIAVSVGAENLSEVSSSVLMAEMWLRTHVLAHYPASKITTIVVGDTVLCNKGDEHELDFILLSLKNIYHSLKRKLAVTESKFVEPFPARPTPLPEIAQSPLHSSVGFSVPSNVAKNPHPPLSQIASPPSLSFPFAPEMPPVIDPATPPFGFTFPPCNPAPYIAPAPEIGVVQKLWCVAKPSVPAETLQQSMDYACGKGGAACEEIQPNGNCYYPDTVVAHASYAFNSYWQKTKRSGGTCSFGGTAMLINADPSFLHCQFVLS